jgi:hypothetical protein
MKQLRAQVKDLYSLDVEDLVKYSPDDPDCFSLHLRVIVGPKDQLGEESFDVEVCTPNWFLHKYGRQNVIIGRHFLIVFEYNFERIRRTIIDFCENCTGDTWEEVALKVSRLGYWEFEDYVP